MSTRSARICPKISWYYSSIPGIRNDRRLLLQQSPAVSPLPWPAHIRIALDPWESLTSQMGFLLVFNIPKPYPARRTRLPHGLSLNVDHQRVDRGKSNSLSHGVKFVKYQKRNSKRKNTRDPGHVSEIWQSCSFSSQMTMTRLRFLPPPPFPSPSPFLPRFLTFSCT